MQADKMSGDNGNYDMNDFDNGYFGGNNFPNAPYESSSNAKGDSNNGSLWGPYDGNNFGNNWDGGSSEVIYYFLIIQYVLISSFSSHLAHSMVQNLIAQTSTEIIEIIETEILG
jgi:hypothetical protein